MLNDESSLLSFYAVSSMCYKSHIRQVWVKGSNVPVSFLASSVFSLSSLWILLSYASTDSELGTNEDECHRYVNIAVVSHGQRNKRKPTPFKDKMHCSKELNIIYLLGL